jgi:hypothetical protein
MLKRFALMIAATGLLVVPATSALAAPPAPTGVAPEELCFATTPWALQSTTCGEGTGGPGTY